MTTLQSGQGDGGVWISISELATRKKVTRQSATERVNRLVSQGLIETRSDGRKRLVDLASYDRAVGEAGDAYREQGAETKRETEPESRSPALRDAQTERAQYEARLKALDLAERTAKVVPVRGPNGVEAAMVRAGAEIARLLDMPLSRLGEIEEAARADMAKLRRVMKDIIFEQRKAMGDSLRLMQKEAEDGMADGYELDLAEGDE